MAACILLALACASQAGGVPGPDVAAGGSPARQIDDWTRQLDADEYQVRETATRQLIAAGFAAVEPVARAIERGTWEVTTRGIFILQELSLARDLATEQAALAALERIAAARSTPLARRGQEALAKLDHLRRQRAQEIFSQLGAAFDPEHRERDVYSGSLSAMEIGPQWRGEVTDLRRLRWLSDIQQLTLTGEQVNETWLPHLRGMESLTVLKIKRADIRGAALEQLREIPSLRCIKLLYLPIGDEAVPGLQGCRQLMQLKIFGTNISPAGASQLAAVFGADSVDCRKGAFLGISPSTSGENWFVQSVTDGSAAAHAGLEPGDVIVKYEGQPVRDFQSLVRLISQSNPGDTVTVQVLRDGDTLSKRVTFGEWD